MIKLFTDLVILRYFFNLVVYVFLFIAINIYFVRKTTTLECIHYHAMWPICVYI